ncbi:hypothetical protein ANN_19374 [Periplaneta americana]|uniref:Mariner Mos1 transposase n=1 Tax=Periplaneta americana TaxID=6978 RepID=A0ABQ8S9Q3_PERAM|nr:hypothetical protein ANN_19374 [Periplaneta americana]
MSPGSSTESYPAFTHIGLRETPEKTSTRLANLHAQGVIRGNKTKMKFTVTGASKFSQRSVVQFLAAEGVLPIEIHRPIKKVYVDYCMLRARVCEWTKRYQQGRTSLEDGRPAPWPMGPKWLTDEQKQHRMGLSFLHLMRYEQEVEAFLERIVTVKYNMVQLRTAEQARNHAVEARHITTPKKFRNFTTADKMMLMLFFDSEGLLFCHFMGREESVTSARYSKILRTELRRAVKNERPGRLSEGVILLHDIARPHTVRHTMDTIRDLR